jgi:hypothetical protein
MAGYQVKQPNIFGRIGTGIGKGLAEQVPKEIERSRLASGLKDFEKESENLNPIQQLARISAIPGVTPQMIQSFQELAKNQNQGNAYRKGAGGNLGQNQRDQGFSQQPNRNEGNGIRDVQFANIDQRGGQQGIIPPEGQVNNLLETPNIGSRENTPQVSVGNALNEQNLTRSPWTPQQRQSITAGYIDQGFLPEQAKQLAADDEARDLATPEANKERQKDIDEAKTKVRETLNRYLEKKLQKSGEGLFEDIEGKMIVNAERGMIRDLIQNPKADIDNVANDWSERLYNTAKAKGKLNTLGKTTGFENFFKGESTQKKLREYRDIFHRSGNLEEYKNILQGPSFGMSAQAAASEAYPPNPKIDKVLSKYKSSSGASFHAPEKYQEARKIALDIEKEIGPDDSVLSIVRKLSDKDPYFDQQAFLDQISEDKDQLGLNARQRLELADGVRNILPNWADLLYLPIFRR